MKAPATTSSRVWHWKHGWIASAVCFLGAEGLIAGSSRSCMPSFNLNILLGQLLLVSVLSAPMLLGILYLPAFLFASSPRANISPQKWPRIIFLAIVVLAILLALGFKFGSSAFAVVVALLVSGVLLGAFVKRLKWVQRLWLPIGLVIAVAAGSLAWTFGHYGQNNCWP